MAFISNVFEKVFHCQRN